VVNCKSGVEIWISRRLVGEVSRIDDPVLIVGLNRELEYRAARVAVPAARDRDAGRGGRLSMARAVGERGGPRRGGIRLESNDRRIFKLIAAALPVAVLLCLAALRMNQWARSDRAGLHHKDQQYLALTGRDDYFAVVQKLGKPATDHWQSESGELQCAPGLPDRKYTVILMGSGRQAAVYIGRWTKLETVHSVALHSGGTTASLLRTLKRF